MKNRRPMKTVTPFQMMRLDRQAQLRYGIAPLILMENAGRCAAEEASRMLGGGRAGRVVCVCGTGNNGGDGFVCARHLVNRGIRTDVFLLGSPGKLKGDARLNFLILKKMGLRIRLLKEGGDFSALRRALKKSRVVVDAIFGIGFKGRPRAWHEKAIQETNACLKPVLSLDVPSGLDPLTGRAEGACVRAQRTITFGFPKTGLFRGQGPFYSGKVLVADISLPRTPR
ncbi:MAG: NAD(P)H-hydrate epimerase [Candidatus Omnitrophota bacterium]